MRIHDGAYGTLLERHLRGDETVDDLAVRAPALVVDAHRAYLDAGADAIQTTSFLAWLRDSRRRRETLLRAAVACGREAIAASGRDDALLVATLGPAGDEPRAYWHDLELLLECDVRAVQCETITTRATAEAFLHAWRDVAAGVDDIELRVGCSVAPSAGADAATWVRDLASELPEEVLLGLNCCEGPLGLRPVLAMLAELRAGVWVMPSAGLPQRRSDGLLDWPLASSGHWAEAVGELVDGLDLHGVGGCCGTHPASIAALVAGS